MDLYNLIYKGIIYPVWGFIFVFVTFMGFLFFYVINEYTAAATWILAMSTIALVLITYIQSNKQYKKSLIEKQLEEFYIPLIERLTYPLSPVNGILPGNDINSQNFGVVKLKEDINKILRIKGYLSDIPLYDKKSGTHYVFNGYVGSSFEGKAHWDKWFFETKEEKGRWIKLLNQLYKSYEDLVEEYYHMSGRDIKTQAFGIGPEKAFEVKPADSKNWLG